MPPGDSAHTRPGRKALHDNPRLDLIRPTPPARRLLQDIELPDKPILHSALRACKREQNARPQIKTEAERPMGRNPRLPAFDRGLVTFDDAGRPEFSPTLSELGRAELRWQTPIPLTDKHKKRLAWHRAKLFVSQGA
ncbi:hypothetical protein GCM10008966_29700 [Rhodovulum strictum]